MALDQTLTVLDSSPSASQSLIAHNQILTSWFTYYATTVTLSLETKPTGINGIPTELLTSGMGFNQSQTNISINLQQSSTKLLKGTNVLCRVISYKSIFAFLHNFAIVPYLVKEDQLYRCVLVYDVVQLIDFL